MWPARCNRWRGKGVRKVRFVNQVDLENKRVFIRVDFNVPLDEERNITDDNRIRAALPTINYALDEDAKVIVASHMGRPKGKRVEELSMEPVARRLARLVKKDVAIAPDCVGPEVEKMVEQMSPGEIIMLENLRFHPGETKNDPEFSKALAKLCDVYVDDAFAVAHRPHASVVGITDYVPTSVAGFTMKKEMEYFRRALVDTARPLAAVIGGAKAITKLGALENLLDHVDKMLIGGAMANTLLEGPGIRDRQEHVRGRAGGRCQLPHPQGQGEKGQTIPAPGLRGGRPLRPQGRDPDNHRPGGAPRTG